MCVEARGIARELAYYKLITYGPSSLYENFAKFCLFGEF